MIETFYSLSIFVFALIGAGRLALWVVGRGWHWVVKAILLLVVVSVMWGFLGQLTSGSPKTDLRIMTEILASAGVIFSLEYLFPRVRNNWGRVGLAALAGIFLFLTWSDTLDRGVGSVSNINRQIVTSPPSGTSHQFGSAPLPEKTQAQSCAERGFSFQTCQKMGN